MRKRSNAIDSDCLDKYLEIAEKIMNKKVSIFYDNQYEDKENC